MTGKFLSPSQPEPIVNQPDRHNDGRGDKKTGQKVSIVGRRREQVWKKSQRNAQSKGQRGKDNRTARQQDSSFVKFAMVIGLVDDT